MKKLWLSMLLPFLFSSLVWAAGETDSDSTSTTAASSGKYSESPILAALVAKGELPPVEQRLPEEPKILEALESVGTYGGTLQVIANAAHPWNDVADSPERSQYPLRMNFDGSVEADQAKSYEISPDNMSFTLHLRKGMKWSNGDDFSAEDFVFKKVKMDDDEAIDTWGYAGQIETVSAIDDYTVLFEFNAPFPRVVLDMLHWRGSDWAAYVPSTWLKQWHIEYNSEANEKAKAEGFDNWSAALNDHATFCCPAKDMNKPTLHPWKWEEQTSTVRIWDRNPYYFSIDTAGQQLPYIDRVISQTVDMENYKLKVIAGEADYAGAMSLGEYPLLKTNESRGNYTVTLVPGLEGSNVSYTFGLDNIDPVKRKLFLNVDFRRAMSLAIDRDEINETVWYGQAIARQATVNDDVSFYKSEWGEDHPYARYAPDEANQMLDSIGLNKRDRNGLRLMSNGKPLDLILSYNAGEEGASEQEILSHELVKEYWAKVGVSITLNPLDSDTIRANESEGTMDVIATRTSGIEMYSFLSGNSSLLGAGHRGAGRYYAYWTSDGAEGEKPPADLQNLYDMARKEMQSTLYGSAEYRAIRQKVMDLHAEKLWTIGVVGQAPFPVVARNTLRNVATEVPPWAEAWLTLNYYSNMWYFKD